MRAMLAAINCPKGDPGGNLDRHVALLRDAAADGCDVVVFPEMSLSGSVEPATQPERLLALDSPVVGALAEATGRHGVAAVFGVAEQGPHITQVYAAGGTIRGVYRKRHLGDGEEAYRPGRSPALFHLGDVPFGVAICAESGVDYPFDEPAAAGARIVFFCAAPGLYGPRRTDD
jgi:predicted amidohydrolase